jgi:hypothetical protein
VLPDICSGVTRSSESWGGRKAAHKSSLSILVSLAGSQTQPWFINSRGQHTFYGDA